MQTRPALRFIAGAGSGNAMSRAHAVAPAFGAEGPYRRPAQGARVAAFTAISQPEHPATPSYVERAMLLWPRLDRARVRRLADNPARIAELVSRRTSQPHDVILAMLTRETERPIAPKAQTAGLEAGRRDTARVALRIVRSEEGAQIEVQDVLPA
jgi:hypothetical protein